MTRVYAAILSLLLTVVVLMPIRENFREKPRDAFPLSYYPMFTHTHPQKQRHMHIVGITGDGRSVPIHYRYAGVAGLNQVRKQISRRVRRSEEEAQKLCAQIAEKVARRRKRALRDVVEVRIVTSTYRPVDYFGSGTTEPLARTIRASCPVDWSGTGEDSP